MDKEEDLGYLKNLTLAEITTLANGRLVKVIDEIGWEEWLIPTGNDYFLLWTPSTDVSARFIVYSYQEKTLLMSELISRIASITFHEGLEIRPILKID